MDKVLLSNSSDESCEPNLSRPLPQSGVVGSTHLLGPKHTIRKKILRNDSSSSSSSIEVQNGCAEPGYFLDGHHLKKRQNSDLNLDGLTNSKRTCLQDFVSNSSSQTSARTNGFMPSTSSKNFFNKHIVQSSCLRPDRTYESDSESPQCSGVVKTENEHNERTLSRDMLMAYFNKVGESGSDEDFQIASRNGALKGGRQLPDPAAYKRSARNKARRILDSDSEEDSISQSKYRRQRVIFSSSDSDEGIQAPSFSTHATKKTLQPSTLDGCDSSDQDTAGPSPSAVDYPMIRRRIHGPASFRNMPPSCLARPQPRSRHQIQGEREEDRQRTHVRDPGPSMRVTRSTAIPHRPPRKGLRRCRGSASLSMAFPDIFDAEEESSEVEFFSANSYSDTETNAASMNGLSLQQKGNSKQVRKAPRNQGDASTVTSSEDEISVLFSSGPPVQVTPPPPPRRRNVAARAFGRKYSRGARRLLPNLPDIVSLSPDPVEQVRQVEEDERFARMLQAQFDSEVDPDYNPDQPLPSPPQSESSNDSIVDLNDLMLLMDQAYRGDHIGSPPPNFLPPTLRGRSARGRVRGRRRRIPTSFYNEYNALLFGGSLLSHMPVTSRLMLDESSDDNTYESLLNIVEINGGDVPRGMIKNEIDRLPTRKFLVPSSTSEAPAHPRADLNKECQVCLSDYVTGDVLRILPCFHEFHTRCIDKWLKINPSCPVCRVIVNVTA